MNGRPVAALVVLNLAVHCGGPFEGPAADAGADVEQLDHVAGDVAVEVLEEAPHDALAGDVAGDELEQHDAGADVGLVDALEAGCSLEAFNGELVVRGDPGARAVLRERDHPGGHEQRARADARGVRVLLLVRVPARAPRPRRAVPGGVDDHLLRASGRRADGHMPLTPLRPEDWRRT